MPDQPLHVLVTGEPVVLRSAIHACLSGDPRFDAVLTDKDDPTTGEGSSARPTTIKGAPWAKVTAAGDGAPRVELLLDQESRPIPFQGMRRLADALIRAVDACTAPTPEPTETSHA